MNKAPGKLLTDGVMTGTNVLRSKPIFMASMLHASFAAIWSAGASPVGTFKVEAAFDHDPAASDITNGTWTDMGLTIGAVSGNSGQEIISLVDTAFPFIRLVYTNSSGTGTLNIWGCAKGQG